MLKAGIIGLGTIGKTHLNSYKAIPEDKIKLEAAFDLSDENLAFAEGLRVYKSLDDFFANECDKLDFVDICLPTFLHKDVAVRAMECGFNVLCEKPMALSSKEAEEMQNASTRTGKRLMIAHILRFMEDMRIIKSIVDSGTMGSVRHVSCTTRTKGLPSGFGNWFLDDKLSGGPFLDVHIHDTDLLIWLFGMPNTVSSVSPKDCREIMSSNMTYNNGMIMNCHCDFSLKCVKHDYGRNLRLIFQRGYIIKTSTQFVAVDENDTMTDLTLKRQEAGYDAFVEELTYFADCIESGKSFSECPARDSVNAVKLIMAELESANQKGKTIIL